MKFLIDECLAISLARIAQDAGFPESTHVSHRGLAGRKDWELMAVILDQNWTFVTRNSDDFRPRASSSSRAPCYLGVALHAGLVCLNPPAGSGRADMEAYFGAALAVIGNPPDLVNQVLEVWPSDAGRLRIDRYAMPDHS